MRINILFVLGVTGFVFSSCSTKENISNSTLSYDMKTFRVESTGGCADDTSSCASYTVEYPVFHGLATIANDSLQKKISEAVDTGNPLADSLSFEAAGRRFVNDFEETKKEFPESAMGWYYNATVEVNITSDTLISLSAKNESFTGGAHGGFGTYFINLNPTTGESLTLRNFLKPGYEEDLRRIAEHEFRKSVEMSDTASWAVQGFEFPDDKFQLNTNYGFTQLGIVFVFNIYEIGPYVLGAQEVLIPYEKIEHLKKERTIKENL
jgi:hypothetical protein